MHFDAKKLKSFSVLISLARFVRIVPTLYILSNDRLLSKAIQRTSTFYSIFIPYYDVDVVASGNQSRLLILHNQRCS